MNIFEELKKLNLPSEEYIVIGSSILGALNIRDIKDIDLLVTPKLFDELIGRGWQHNEIEIQGRMRQRLMIGPVEAYKDFYLYGEAQDVFKMIKNAEIIQSFPFMPLSELLKMKKSLNRPKDLDDIELINKYLEVRS